MTLLRSTPHLSRSSFGALVAATTGALTGVLFALAVIGQTTPAQAQGFSFMPEVNVAEGKQDRPTSRFSWSKQGKLIRIVHPNMVAN